MTDQPPFDLVPLATVRVTRGDVYRLGQTAFHKRVIGGIAHGRWEGERFSGEYYVAETTHTLGSAGYRTTFKARREEGLAENVG